MHIERQLVKHVPYTCKRTKSSKKRIGKRLCAITRNRCRVINATAIAPTILDTWDRGANPFECS